jgi:acyl-coenzyme A synthetase/AMP-(fatty) acid ligase
VELYLKSKGIVEGDRIILLFVDNLEFTSCLIGCFRAGVIAVPHYPPDISKLDDSFAKMSLVVSDCGAKACFLDTTMDGLRRSYFGMTKKIYDTGVQLIFSFVEVESVEMKVIINVGIFTTFLFCTSISFISILHVLFFSRHTLNCPVHA